MCISAGKLTTAPPLGPLLSANGFNSNKIVSYINDLTKDYLGQKICVELKLYPWNKEFECKILKFPLSAKILSITKQTKGGKNNQPVSNISTEQIDIIYKEHIDEFNTKDKKKCYNQIIGTLRSMKYLIDNKPISEYENRY